MSVHWDTRNKRWRFTFTRVVTGRRVRASKLLPKGWSKAQADAFDQHEGGRLFALARGVEQSDPLISEAVMLYLRDKAGLKSIHQATEHLARILWAYEGKHMSQLADVADAVTREGFATEKKPATIRNRLALLKAACRYAWKRHHLTATDPTGRMVLPTVRNESFAHYTRREMLTVCRACTNHAAQIAARVSFYSGMRLGEILRAWPDGDIIMLDDTKNGSARAIPAHPRIRHLLPYLPLDAPKITIQRAWKRACDAVGVTGKTFHSLRHSAGTEMVNAGVPERVIAEVLGHVDLRSTRRYTHPSRAVVTDAVRKIGRKAA